MKSRATPRPHPGTPPEPTPCATSVQAPSTHLLGADPDLALARWVALNLQVHSHLNLHGLSPASLPATVLHASTDTADHPVARESGADAAVPTPPSSRDLQARLHKLMRRAHEQRRCLAETGPRALPEDPADTAGPPGLGL